MEELGENIVVAGRAENGDLILQVPPELENAVVDLLS